ncbi:hypothetical protein POM88_010097 [Heracleum sosnowskyi]|uniref:Uncharacterized protein n=1 Tax=Heracleum sosnowskyi TaxID=360622 RepID=A0AAD8N850_9APIA|nr:hypothetical protein POM88_010097 [Heracleum sosnowskyi]
MLAIINSKDKKEGTEKEQKVGLDSKVKGWKAKDFREKKGKSSKGIGTTPEKEGRYLYFQQKCSLADILEIYYSLVEKMKFYAIRDLDNDIFDTSKSGPEVARDGEEVGEIMEDIEDGVSVGTRNSVAEDEKSGWFCKNVSESLREVEEGEIVEDDVNDYVEDARTVMMWRKIYLWMSQERIGTVRIWIVAMTRKQTCP